jgi:hypothetical protein
VTAAFQASSLRAEKSHVPRGITLISSLYLKITDCVAERVEFELSVRPIDALR